MIVAAILGEEVATSITPLVGVAEIGIAVWILSGLFPRTCAAVQTTALVTMNALELLFAKHLLLAPIPMICLNIAFLGIVWYNALFLSDKVVKPNS